MPRKARALGVSMEELVEARGERINYHGYQRIAIW